MSISSPTVYAEVYAVLSALSDEYIRKTPGQILDFIAENRDKNIKIKIIPDVPLEEQSLSAECLAVLAWLKLDYWCDTQEEKEELKALLDLNEEKASGAPLSPESKKNWIELLKKKQKASKD